MSKVKPKYIPSAWEEVDCMFCGSSNKKFYEHYGCDNQYTHVICNNCQLVYQSPRPVYNQEFIDAAYGDYFVFDNDLSYEKEMDENSKLFSHWNDELDEILTFDKNGTAIIDVGSAMGQFLFLAKKRFVKTYGADMSEDMAGFVSKKLNVPVFVEQFHLLNPDVKFSTIHMSHVIEHIPNPKEWLSKSKELLEPDGVLSISVPNMFSISRRFKLLLKRLGLRNDRWKDDWRTPDHLFEPTPQSLRQFVENEGFEVLSLYTYSRSDSTSKKLMNKILYRKLLLGSNLRAYVKLK